MERLTRLIGIGMLLGLMAASLGNFQQALSATTSEPTGRQTALAAASTDYAEGKAIVSAATAASRSAGTASSGDPASPPPRYLRFSETLSSGVYSVSDLPGSRDRDVTIDPPAPTDYPAETDLMPDFSLAERGSIAPGLYATAFGVRECSYQIRRINSSGLDTVIGEDRLKQGRTLVSINEIEPDFFTSSPKCGEWSQWSPLVEPLNVVGNGDYWIGDLEQGSWSVPVDCVWEKVVGFRGAELVDVQDSAVGPSPLVIDDETLGVRIRGCEGIFVLEERTGRP